MRNIKSEKHISTSSTISLLIAVSLALLPEIVFSKPSNVTEAELRLLPRYCRDSQWFPHNYKERANYWVGIMGKSFHAVHHYCWGLTNMNRARRAGAEHKVGTLENVLNDFWYVVDHSPPDFILLPEIYTKIGEVELLLRHPNKANEAFSLARDLKPDYWPAYSHWVEFLMNNGKRADAMKVVTAGLEHAPNAKVLLEQYRLLGGKPGDIPRQVKEIKTTDDSATSDGDTPTPAEEKNEKD